MSLACSHTLKIYNLTPSNNGPNAVMEAVRKDVVSLWKQGFKYDKEGRGEWSIRFNGNIWRMRGDDGVVYVSLLFPLTPTYNLLQGSAHDMSTVHFIGGTGSLFKSFHGVLVDLFIQGYSYLCSVQNTRLVS